MKQQQHDVSRLPVWGQDLVRRLERDLAGAREKLAAGPEDSTVFAQRTAETETPLGDSQIKFRHAGVTFTVGFDPAEGELDVRCDNGKLAVYPNVTNSVTIKRERYY
jgi:hypothetical protein